MKVRDECKSWFMEMKWKRVHRYIVFKIDEGSKAVIVDKVGGPGEGYHHLAGVAGRTTTAEYAVLDLRISVHAYRNWPQEQDRCFISWSPTKSRIRAKILYATSKQGLRRVLDGVHYEVQATDPTEMGYDVITERAK
ncbi:uncharacterized protein A4U43_C04F21450 [Asparagus officinalis]|uniref:ADF-H domain-containing protein n=2 Tax=Asparagus officinalis TaxID=4686 RepID=A0A5P1F2R3_ASPOF|nr:uncharacterized protein A4U43_C04F21450 [Asparagus officinalis]